MTRSIILEAGRPVIRPRRKEHLSVTFLRPSLGLGDTYKKETEKHMVSKKKDLHKDKRLPSFTG